MATIDTNPTERTLARLASTLPGASRVFQRHGLDFCCHGQVSLDAACRAAGLDPAAVLAELEAEAAGRPAPPDWEELAIPPLIEAILERFHQAHREEVPRLLALARQVEERHADKASTPRGLAQHLARMAEELELHMRKEEQVLFPLLLAGAGRRAQAPVQAMEAEHEDHGRNLARLRELTNGFVPPEEACASWRALYLGLEALERDLMEHIHVENNVLFPMALRS